MLDDIDYSALSAQEPAARPAPKAGVSDRSVVKKSEKKKLDVQAIEEKAKTLEESVGAPEIPDPLAQYGLPAIGILGGLAAAYGAWKKGEKNASYPEASVPADNKGAAAAKSVEQNVEQSLASQADRLAQLKERVLAGKQAGLGSPVQTQPTYNVPTADVPQIAAQPSAPVQPPAQPAPVAIEAPAVPSAAEAVATGQSPSKAVQIDVAQQLDEASGVTGRVRRTKAQIEQAMKEAFAKAPEGMLPSAPAKTNKWPGDVIGQGGWHWFEGQGGTPEEWTRLYGRTNQPYQRVVTDVKGGVLGVPPKPEGAKGGTVPRQEYVPEYIKGAASPAMLLNVAANALGVAGLANAYKEGKKTGDWSNLGLGVIDQILSNVAPKAGLAMSLMAPGSLNVGEDQEIAKRQYEQKVGAGRGVAPTSAYQR